MTQQRISLFIFCSLFLAVHTAHGSEDSGESIKQKPINYEALHDLNQQDLKKMICFYAHQPRHIEEIFLRQKKDNVASTINWPFDLGNNTLLHHAVTKNDYYFAQTLVKYGANPDALNSKKQTPLSIATKRNFDEIKTLLETEK